MNRREKSDFLPSKRVLVLAGVLFLGGIGYLLSGTGFVQAVNFFSDNQDKQTATNTESSFLANQNPPESGSIADGEIATVTEKDNITQRTANSVAPRALALAAAQENGEDISDEDIARVASSMSANIEISEPETFQRGDFDQYDSASQENIQAYAEKIAEVIYNQANQGPSTAPPKILADYLQDNGSNLNKIDEYINLNNSLVNQLQNITVPAPYLQSHIRLTEGFALAENSLKKIKQVDNDPTVAVIGIKQYREATDTVVSVSDRLAKQLSNDINNL